MRRSYVSLAATILALGALPARAQSGGSEELLPPAPAAVVSDSQGVGWRRPDVPNGLLLPLHDLGAIDNDRLQLPGHRTALYALGKDAGDYHPEREPLVLVHGFRGEPVTFGPLLARLAASDRYQVYVVVFDDYRRRTTLNAEDFAEQLRQLRSSLGRPTDLTIVAHSMGGLLARRTLNELTVGPGGGIDSFGNIRFFAVDTPWHGYKGVSDRGLLGFVFKGPRWLVVPRGFEDLIASSKMFQGDPHAKNPAERAGLYDVTLPPNVTTEITFAKESKIVLDYNEKYWLIGDLEPLDEKLVALYAQGTPVTGSRAVENFWKALQQSDAFGSLDADLHALASNGTLDLASVHAALEKHYPEFAGTHRQVFAEHPEGPSLLDHLEEKLTPASTRGVAGALRRE